MTIDGQEISPEYAQALKDVHDALEARSEAPRGEARWESQARYSRAVAHAVAVKQKENPMNLKDAMEARGEAQANLRTAVLGMQEAQKSANAIMAAYQVDPRASIRERWEKAMARVSSCDEAVGTCVKALGKAEEDLAQAKSAEGPESYTVDQIENAYYDVESFTQCGLLAALRSLP